MIIDFRLRPPHPNYEKLRVQDPRTIRRHAERMWVEPAPSALQRSMPLFESEMAEAGIDMGVMNARYADTGTITNDEIAAVSKEYSGKLFGLGSIEPNWKPEAIRAEVARCVVDLGLKGMSIDTYMWTPPIYADNQLLGPLYKACIEFDVPVAMTLSGGNPPDLSYCAPHQVDAVAAAFPDLKIVVAHGCWPHVQEMCGVVFRRPNVWVSPDMYMFTSGVNDYVQLANTFARDRFLFATCYPSLPLKPVVDLHHELPFREGVLEKVFWKNAASLLKLNI